MRFAALLVAALLLIPAAAAAGERAWGGVAFVFMTQPVVQRLGMCADPSRDIVEAVASTDGTDLRWQIIAVDPAGGLGCPNSPAPGAVPIPASFTLSNAGLIIDVVGGSSGLDTIIQYAGADADGDRWVSSSFTFADGRSTGDGFGADVDPIEPSLALPLVGTTHGAIAQAYDLRGSTLVYRAFSVAAYESADGAIEFNSGDFTEFPGELDV